jgi:hypothetical protein
MADSGYIADARAMTARQDDAPAAHQAAFANTASVGGFSGGGGLIHTTSGSCEQRVDRLQGRGCCYKAFS